MFLSLDPAVVINVGGLVEDKHYKMEIFFMERYYTNYLRFKYKKTGNYRTDFSNLLVNLLPSKSYAPFIHTASKPA